MPTQTDKKPYDYSGSEDSQPFSYSNRNSDQTPIPEQKNKINKPDDDFSQPLNKNKNQIDSDSGLQTAENSHDKQRQNDPGLEKENNLFNPERPLQGTFPKLNKAFFKNVGGNKKTWAGAFGLGTIVILIISGGLLNFLNIFKLEHFMQNVEKETMIRFSSATDRRSSKWAEAYIQIRLTELNGEDTPGLFRSNRVDTNSPLTDWYKTMRASKFEKDLAKRGIVFTNFQGAEGVQKGFAILEVNGKKVAGIDNKDMKMTELIDKLNSGGEIKGVTDFDLDKPGANKQAREAIKKIVNDNTHSWNVIKRRHVRKSIQNMTGVKSWQFFETSRDKIDAKKLDMKKKLLAKVLPETTKSGKFVGCLLGLSDCKNTTMDTSEPGNKTEGELNTTDTDMSTDKVDPENPDSKVSNDGQAEDAISKAMETPDVPFAQVIRQVVSKFAGGPASIISFVDTLARIDESMKDNSVSKMIYMAKLTQYMAIYQGIGIAQDQLKTGQVTSEEVNGLMNELNGIGNNEAWENASSGSVNKAKAQSQNEFTAAKDKQTYCSPEYQELSQLPENAEKVKDSPSFVCEDDKLSSGNNAKKIEDWWNSTVGTYIGPILEAYRATPFGGIISWFSEKIDAVTAPVMSAILEATGQKQNVENAVAMAMTKAADFLGAAPFLNEMSPGSKVGIGAFGGGAATQSVALRDAGGILSTPATAQANTKLVHEYQNKSRQDKSLYEKYISLNNSESLMSKSTYNVATTLTDKNSASNVIGKSLAYVKNNILNFNFSTAQAASDPYATDELYGVSKIDMPEKCLNRSVLNSYKNPKDSTNIQEILGKDAVPDSDLTWDLLRNSEDWYGYVYSEGRRPSEEQAEKIYNCELLDNLARGGTGNLYGYTDDNGLDPASNDGDPGEPGNCPKPPKGKNWSEAHLQPNAILIGRCTFAMWPEVQDIGGWRPSDPYPDHPSGRAVDIMIPQGCVQGKEGGAGDKLGNEIADFFHKNAKDYGVNYMIWKQRSRYPGKDWNGMSDRGSCTANHWDHIHIYVNKGKAPAWFNNNDTSIDTKNIYKDSSDVACASGTESVGVEDGYREGKKVRIRLCSIPKFPCSNEECNGGYGVNGDGHALVNSRISGAMLQLIKAAKEDGMNLSTISSFRTMAHQQELWNANPNPELVAPPGYSNHQMGLAIDFEGTNVKNCAGRCTDPGSPVWRWLNKNAKKYGFTQYDNESWHWSVGGN